MASAERRHPAPAWLVALVLGLVPVAGGSAPDYTEGPDACLKCHDADTDVPVLEVLKTPHAARTDPKSPFADHGCETCHGPGSDHAKRLRRGEERPPLFDFDLKRHGAEAIEEKCTSCHAGTQHADWDGSPHERAALACTSCHEVHRARDPMVDRDTQVGACTDCHRKQKAELKRVSSHPLDDGRMVCTECHQAHGASNDAMLVTSTVQQLCTDCHAEKRGPFLWEHAPASEDCALCHKPHGSNHAALLNRRAPLLCQECHSAAGHPSVLPPTGASQFLLARSCSSCHSQVHGTNHPAGSKLNR
jgi:DmsE family decaheme c-type cytochrome